MNGKNKCSEPGCNQLSVGQCAGYKSSCGRYYCSSHTVDNLCIDCARQKAIDNYNPIAAKVSTSRRTEAIKRIRAGQSRGCLKWAIPIGLLGLIAICIMVFSSKPRPTATPVATSTAEAINTSWPTSTLRPTPWPTREPSITPVYWCNDLELIRLDIGSNAMVAWDAANLRSTPEVPADWAANRIAVLFKGDRVRIVGGPACAHDGTWWQVETENSLRGWVREYVLPQGYLLEPVP